MSNKMENKNSGKEYWKSLREYYDPEELKKIKHDEFLEGAIDFVDLESMPPISRRKFLALLSASSAFAFAACTNYKDKGEIVPYNRQPEEIILGKANYYASTLNCCSRNCSVLIKTREGRPIKIDGNPEHPVSQGKVCVRGQASILNLYDPDRLGEPLQKLSEKVFSSVSWKSAEDQIKKSLNEAVKNGKEIAIISRKINSATALQVLSEFVETYPTAKLYFYDVLTNKNQFYAWKECYNLDSVPSVKLEQAKVILAIESDFLNSDGDFVNQTIRYAKTRNVDDLKNFSRLYVLEGNLTLTGANADYRIKLRSDFIREFLFGLINEINKRVKKQLTIPYNLSQLIAQVDLNVVVKKFNLDEKVIKTLVEDLIRNRGRSVVLAGNRLSKEENILILLINEILDATNLYDFSQSLISLSPENDLNDFQELITKIKKGNVEVLINFDANPVYDLSNLDFKEALKKVNLTVTLSELKTETASLSDFILPIHNPLESWNDFQTYLNVINLQQPVINPLYNTRQKESIILTFVYNEPYHEKMYHKKLKSRWEKEVYPKIKPAVDFESFWYASLHDGFVNLTNNQNIRPTFTLKNFKGSTKTYSDRILLGIHSGAYTFDGRFANNGWLYELPHPITKIVWDNYATVSPAFAKRHNIENGDVIEITNGKVKSQLPVFIQAGVCDNAIFLELGFGHSECGEIGRGVGVNVNKFLNLSSSSRFFDYVSFVNTGKKYNLVTAQEHHALDDTFVKDFHRKRKIIQEGTLEEYEKNKNFIQAERKELLSIVEEVEYKGVKWAMAIDMNKCTGCNVCVVSCIAENNIPMVGKDQVEKGREMHWMRIDTYFSGTPEDVLVSNQPMLCQHCDNAPCENVCPVSATNHSSDGLNQMAYNRCVGTRYCANNCPYKVRRFNFFDFRSEFANDYQYREPLNFLNNPEVTVRSRGVMEKCTFCIQRIMEARQETIEKGIEFDGSGVMTACQQACPSSAIVFGNMNDPKSEIARLRKHDLAYYVLEETNVKPNVSYITRLRNINSEGV